MLGLLAWAIVSLVVITVFATRWLFPAFPAVERELAVIALLTSATLLPPVMVVFSSSPAEEASKGAPQVTVLVVACVELALCVQIWLYLHANPLADAIAVVFGTVASVATGIFHAAQLLALVLGVVGRRRR